MKKKLTVILLALTMLFTFMPATAYAGQSNAWSYVNGMATYYYGSDGYFISDRWAIIDGVFYYFDADARVHRGWLKFSGGYYYFDPDKTKPSMTTGWKKSTDTGITLRRKTCMWTIYTKARFSMIRAGCSTAAPCP